MNRRSLFSWLLGFCGVASAQDLVQWTPQWREQWPELHTARTHPPGSNRRRQEWKILLGENAGKPKNNQCPVCGMMAEPFKPIPPLFCGDTLIMLPGGHNLGSGCDSSLLTQNCTRCKRCNAAFWQDAEGITK
jgi:hypothetical protein